MDAIVDDFVAFVPVGAIRRHATRINSGFRRAGGRHKTSSEIIVSIDQPKVVDFCGISQADGSCVLTISDQREWNDWGHLLALQEKLNNYLAFIESGEIYTARPEARERAIEISIRCKFAPEGEDDFRFLQLARDAIRSAGFRFSVIADTGEFEIPESHLRDSPE